LVLGAGVFVACVDDIRFGDAFLEKAPGVDVNIDSVFVRGENAKAFLWNIYGQMNNPFTYQSLIGGTDPVESLSDIISTHCTWGMAYRLYYAGVYTETNQENNSDMAYNRFPFIAGGDGGNRVGIWTAVRKAWIFIENIDRVPDLSAEEKSRLKGEAFVIMGCRYYDAFRNFGGLPLMDHAYLPDEISPGRATIEQTVDFIDGLFQRAINEPHLPWVLEDVPNEAGRMTKLAAYGMKAKLWQYAASPIFNAAAPYRAYDADEKAKNELHSWWGNYSVDRWAKCVEACEAFFEMNAQHGNHALIQPKTPDEAGYTDAYRAAYWFRGDSEKIIEVHYSNMSGYWDWAVANPRSYTYHGGFYPTLEWMEMFPMADGRNYLYKNIYGTDNPSNVDIMENRDPRLYESIVVTRENLKEPYLNNMTNVQFWQGGALLNYNGFTGNFAPGNQTGFVLYKWILNFETKYPDNFAYLRMADMHLTYAEALAETGNLSKALDELHKVRERVGLGRIENMNPSLNLTSDKDNLVAEIIRERACELGVEDCRTYDLIRRKMTANFSTPLHELITWRKTAGGDKDTRPDTSLQPGEPWPDFIYEKVELKTSKRSWWTNWDNKWLLEPLPRSEINKGYGLTQNPGW
jgi:hypothetical protein